MFLDTENGKIVSAIWVADFFALSDVYFKKITLVIEREKQ